MARIGVTYEEVELQAETLVARGDNPTLEKVRRALGDRGSNSTLSKYINEWRGRRARTFPSTLSPVAMSDPVNEAVNKVWQQLQEEAQAKIAQVKEEAGKAVDQANQQREQISSEHNQALLQIDTLRTTLNELKTKNFSLESSLNHAQNELGVTGARLREVEYRHAEFKEEKEKQIIELIANKEQNIVYFKEQIQSLNQQHKQEIEELRTSMENQRHQALVKQDALKVENTKLEKTLQKMEGVELQSQILTTELRQQLKLRDTQLTDILHEEKQLLEKLLISEKALSVAETELLEAKHLAEIRKQERESLESAVRQERENIGRLEERLRQLEHRYEMLKNQSQVLVSES